MVFKNQKNKGLRRNYCRLSLFDSKFKNTAIAVNKEVWNVSQEV